MKLVDSPFGRKPLDLQFERKLVNLFVCKETHRLILRKATPTLAVWRETRRLPVNKETYRLAVWKKLVDSSFSKKSCIPMDRRCLLPFVPTTCTSDDRLARQNHLFSLRSSLANLKFIARVIETK